LRIGEVLSEKNGGEARSLNNNLKGRKVRCRRRKGRKKKGKKGVFNLEERQKTET